MKNDESFEKKVKFEGEVKCPHCGFFLIVKAGKKIIEPSKAAVTEDFFSVEESPQSRLETGISVQKDENISAEISDKNDKDPTPPKKKRGRPKNKKEDDAE